MLTDQEALTAIDPNLPTEERVELAGRLVASSAALDAYLDSRPQLEQIIAKATGAGAIKSFQDLNPDANTAKVVNSTAVEEPATLKPPVETEAEKELKALEERVVVLKAAKVDATAKPVA
jgi:hypothetical protein